MTQNLAPRVDTLAMDRPTENRLRLVALESVGHFPHRDPEKGYCDCDPLREVLPGDGRDPAPDWLVEAVERIYGAPIRKPLLYLPGLDQPNIARCRAHLRRWALRQTRLEGLPQ